MRLINHRGKNTTVLKYAGILLGLLLPLKSFAYDMVKHDFAIQISPQDSRIAVQDKISIPQNLRGKTLQFILHAGLKINSSTAVQSVPISNVYKDYVKNYDVPIKQYKVRLKPTDTHLELRYEGIINHPIKAPTEEYARSMSETPGIIDSKGVFLANSTVWYPMIDSVLVNFTMQVTVPQNWSVVSHGERTSMRRDQQQTVVSWEERNPQEEIYLVANQFVEYTQPAGNAQAMVFLRESDEALAQKYLDATGQYLTMYSRLLGPYAYKKFAMVENFWETGFGMPSFTLLGPKVLRFPFILHSSYPHEILHNWWANGVFVNFGAGNWAEGLTAYMADHLIKEQRGQAIEYRRSVLQKYTDYVTTERDFALTGFRSRHSSSTEAIGYGKTMMFFHMLRMQLGDDDFVRALREFYRDKLFKITTFDDLRKAFEQVSGKKLQNEFQQWVKRVGAPALKIKSLTHKSAKAGYTIQLELEQTQKAQPYTLHIPVAVHMQNETAAYQTTVTMNSQKQIFKLQVPALPLRVDVDPEFDVFRRLHPQEVPSALSQGFGATKVLVLIPFEASLQRRQAYLELAQTWQKSQEGQWQIKLDNEINKLPSDRAVWLLGWENKFRADMEKQLKKLDVVFSDNSVQLVGDSYMRSEKSLLLSARNPANQAQTLLWLGNDNIAAMPGLARKLPHYRKYSYLAFEGDEPGNVAKGQWEILNSPMSMYIKSKDTAPRPKIQSTLQKRQALAQLPPVFSSAKMMQDIEYLASENMAGREIGSKALLQASDYIAKVFKEIGLEPGGDQGKSYFQRWQHDFGGNKGNVALKNVVGIIPGYDPNLAGESVIVSAHYDHLGKGWPDVHKGDEGKIHFGADDNASGIAVMLEFARKVAKNWKPKRTIVFIAFTAEEANRVGSRYYVKRAVKYPARKAIGVVNLDTVGRVGEGPVTVFGVGSAREWIHIFRGVGFVTGVQVKSVTNDYGFSDQKSFIDIGVPAVQLFGSVHQDYHRPGDTVHKIDVDGLVKVATVLKETIEYLANRDESMTVTIEGIDRKSSQTGTTEKPRMGRKVSLGTVPDFEYKGKGVRITGTVPGSPAEKAGLQQGDILTHMNGQVFNNLRDFANVLRRMKAGDKATINYKRNGQEKSVEVVVTDR